jgi:carboxyl-terminal processing protease
MTNRRRDFLAIALVLLLAILSFGAGFLFKMVVLVPGSSLFDDNQGNLTIFWEAWDFIDDHYLGDIPNQQQIAYGAVRGSLDTLGDPYTFFVEPAVRDEEREKFRGNFGGVGMTLFRNDDGDVVLNPIPGNPAEEAGILEGDVLLAVDGLDIRAELTVEEIADLIRGEEGTEVVLSVRHLGEEIASEIPIIRAAILLPSVTYRLLDDDPAIGYIFLSRFSGESAGEVQEALEELMAQGANKLILDLRQNTGGLLDAAVDISDLFLVGGPVVIQVSKDEDEKVFEASEEAIAPDLPLVVLIDEISASSSEIVAGALQDRDRATLIGLKTFGKGSVQLVYDLSDGSSIHVTSSRWYTPMGNVIDQHGLEPDIAVAHNQEAVDSGRDLTMEEAIKYLNGG